jgi:hypothetical protein
MICRIGISGEFMKETLVALLALIIIHTPHSTDLLGGERDPIKISFVGDIMMHGAVKRSAFVNNRLREGRSINNRGFDYLFERIRPYLEDSDINVANMEFPVSPPFIGMGMVFNCTHEIIPAIKRSGINLLTIANNHMLDQGRNGLLDTMRYLRHYGMDFIGVNGTERAARGGIIIEINGIRIGFIAYTGISNYGFPENPRGYYINYLYNKRSVRADIRRIKRESDYLIMIAHRGIEYRRIPQKMDRVIMREYLNEGVDLIVGHHPHVLQYIERYITNDRRVTYIFYSIGNFISNQRFSYELSEGEHYTTQESIILNLYLSRYGEQIQVGLEVLPIWTVNDPAVIGGRRFRNIQTVYLPERITDLAGELVVAGREKRDSIRRRIFYLNGRINIIRKILFYKQKIDEIKIRY